MVKPAILALADGTVFRGISCGADGSTTGEVVFNTAMTGYQEILTDPSYCQQIVTLTYPHIGNTGTNSDDFESSKVHAAGLIIRDRSIVTSSWRSEQNLADFLRRAGVVAIADLDTRQLTRHIREHGAQPGCIIAATDDLQGQALVDEAIRQASDAPGLSGCDLAKVVTTEDTYQWAQGESWNNPDPVITRRIAPLHIVAYDFGIKRNILRMMVEHDCRVTVVPATTPAQDVMALKPDGVFLSNGPGDPEPCEYAIEAIRELLDTKVPIFGICLGHQLLALAAGAKTMKMKFGHHGANHPVQDIDSGKVYITSQNHGFAVDEASLPEHLVPTHRSLFDGTLQGIAHTEAPAFSFQGHPEASPGPQDLRPLFHAFSKMVVDHAGINPEERTLAEDQPSETA
ncbi:MAG: glutamine-hydrolyzing carbamoyl-phosphate synthase small subunit [Pseudomonadota bacterium]